jgi:hypothetical protein
MKIIWWRIERPGEVNAGALDWEPNSPDAVITLGEKSFPVLTQEDSTPTLLEKFLKWADEGDRPSS